MTYRARRKLDSKANLAPPSALKCVRFRPGEERKVKLMIAIFLACFAGLAFADQNAENKLGVEADDSARMSFSDYYGGIKEEADTQETDEVGPEQDPGASEAAERDEGQPE